MTGDKDQAQLEAFRRELVKLCRYFSMEFTLDKEQIIIELRIREFVLLKEMKEES
jgi:hypothetical protein